MKQQKTYVSDATATRRQASQVRDRVETDTEFALAVARKIAEQPQLLDGLSAVVARLARNPEAASILDEVFSRGAAELYPRTYRAYLNARFSCR